MKKQKTCDITDYIVMFYMFIFIFSVEYKWYKKNVIWEEYNDKENNNDEKKMNEINWIMEQLV